MEKITKSSDKVLIDPNEPLILPDGTALVGRVEWFLYALCCLDYQNLPTPMSRIEEFANALITGEIPNIQPQSRAEQFFLAILDGNISDLPQPQSRSEVLLDKLARGEFDLSDVEPIQSSYELLLAYLIKNGGIGNIDYVLYEFSEAMKTMYNTVEKPFKSLELSGNTLVNCVLEDTENDDYVSFDQDYEGQSFTINGTSEGAIKSAILKGQTLVNLLTYFMSSVRYIDNQYRIIFNNVGNFDKITVVNKNSKPIRFSYYATNWKHYDVPPFNNVLVEIPEGVATYNIYSLETFGWDSTNYREATDNIVLLHGDYVNQDIPYFDGMQSVKLPVLKTLNNQSNLFFTQTLTNFLSWRCISFDTFIKAEIYVKADGTVSDTLRLIVVQNINGAKKENVYTNDSIKKGVNVEVENVQFIGFHDRPNGIEEKGNGNLLELIESGKLEFIVSDKTNILTVNEDVELRGIGDVKDTLDLLTGEVTQRIGEITFDGSENWIASTNQGRIAYILPHKGVAKVFKSPISDKWICEGNANATSDTFFYIGGSYFNYITNQEVSLADFKAQLSDNPVSVQYFLATESVKTVDLNVVDQNNNKIDKIHVFNETTHVNASSDELTPTVNIGKSVSYPTIIKPSTKYTVDLKRNDKPLTVNLGGTEVAFASGETRKTITTPSTLTNDKLSYYGIGAKCNEIMLIEGEIERNIDYFTGMQSVIMQNQMPILSTTGKNLFIHEKMIIGDGSLYGYYKFKDNENIEYTLSISDKDTSVDISEIYLGMSKLGVNPNGGYEWVLSNGSLENTNTMSITTNFNYVSIHPNNI